MPTLETMIRITPEEKRILQTLALNLGYRYGNDGSITGLLKAIAKGDLCLSQTKR